MQSPYVFPAVQCQHRVIAFRFEKLDLNQNANTLWVRMLLQVKC